MNTSRKMKIWPSNFSPFRQTPKKQQTYRYHYNSKSSPIFIQKPSLMCQLKSYTLSCCGHVCHREVVTRCNGFSWESPCGARSGDVARRVLADCSQCRQSCQGKLAEITREYNRQEAAMLEDARKFGWSSDRVFELTLNIDGEREDAQDKLRRLSRRSASWW